MSKTRLRIKIRAAALLLLGAGLLVAAGVELNHPTGTKGLFMVDKLGAHLRFFDPVTFKEQSAIEVSANPHDFAFSADHRLAYVPIYGDGVYGKNPHPGHEIDIVDLQTQRVVATMDIAPYRAPHGIQIARNGTVYVTCDLDRKVLVIDPKARAIKDTIDTEGTGHWMAILPDGSKLYVANKNDKPFISVLDLTVRKLIGKIPGPTAPRASRLRPTASLWLPWISPSRC